jgi:hypothetical protein
MDGVGRLAERRMLLLGVIHDVVLVVRTGRSSEGIQSQKVEGCCLESRKGDLHQAQLVRLRIP